MVQTFQTLRRSGGEFTRLEDCSYADDEIAHEPPEQKGEMFVDMFMQVLFDSWSLAYAVATGIRSNKGELDRGTSIVGSYS
jgi:hypothetical protein